MYKYTRWNILLVIYLALNVVFPLLHGLYEINMCKVSVICVTMDACSFRCPLKKYFFNIIKDRQLAESEVSFILVRYYT